MRFPDLCPLQKGSPLERQEVAGTETTVRGQSTVSPALAAAQQKLECLRSAHRPDQIERPALDRATTQFKVGRSHPPNLPKVHNSRPNSLPSHLGWNSAPVAKAYRRAISNQEKQQAEKPPSIIPAKPNASPPPQPDTPTASGQSLNLPPDIALAILRNKLAAPGRIWLLLRHLDKQGKGWVSAAAARQELAREQSPHVERRDESLVVCSRRQLRNLLTAGDGIFWERDEERIWLKSMARIAAVLGLSHLSGRPVKLPISILLESIGTVRAHLYATFHAGRIDKPSRFANPEGAPISRKTLEKLSTATRRTQRLYEKRSGVKSQRNYAVGLPHSTAEEQNLAWQHGRAVFRFNDHKGVIGPAGQDYLARQLPNSYDGPHEVQPKGYQRRINRQLADLLNEGITGNGERKTAECTKTASRIRVFYHNGSKAAEVYNRSPHQDLHWKSRVGHRRFRIWHTLPALERRNKAK